MRLLTGAIVVLAIAGVAAQPRADLDAIAEHPALVAGLAPFHAYISTASALPARDRELLILRIAALSRSEVVFSAHGQAARAAGLGPADLTRLAGGRGAPGWNAFDAALVAAADELHAASFVS